MAASRLEDNADIIMGQSPPGETCNTTDIGLPLLNGPTEYGPHHPLPVQFTTGARKRARPGDVLFCVRGSTTGRMNWADREYAIGRGVAAIRHKKKPDLQPFVRAVIEYGLPGLLAQATGSTFPNVSADQLASLWWPPLTEDKQCAIAHILGTLDDKIELNRRMNETLEAMAQALFKSWFVNFDPVLAKVEGRDPGLPKEIADLFPDSFEDSELGEIPKGWKIGRLDDVLTLQRGFDLPTSARTPGPYQVMAASGPSGSHNKFMVRGPGVTTGRSGVLGNVFYVHNDFWPLNTSLWIKEFRRSTPAYAFYLLRRLDFAVFNAGSAVPTLNRNHIHNLPTIMPPVELIHAFDTAAVPLLNRRRMNDDESLTLAALRDTLLPKLISGEIRVKDAEPFAVPVVEAPRRATGPLYTIGHSNHSVQYFISLLERHGIQAVADVRSSPFSRRSPQFNRDALQKALRQSGITYVYLGEELGGRPGDPACYANGRADFGRMSERPAFKKGIERLVEGMGKYRIALLCAEREPINCHRTLLVCRHLRKLGLSIKHILPDGGIEDHRDTELRLVSALKLEPNLFESDRTEEDSIEEAYNRRSGEIAAGLVREESNHDN